MKKNVSSLFYKDLILDDDTPCTILNCILLEVFNDVWYVWDPDTIESEIKREFKIRNVSGILLDKLNALSVLLTTDNYYNTWEIFENISVALNCNKVFIEQMTPLNPEDLCWSLIESRLNDETPGVFSADVDAYIKTVFKSNGLARNPELIKSIYDDYSFYGTFDNKEELIKQKRVEIYCMKNLDKIIDLSKKYFGVNIRSDIKNEIKSLPFNT